MNKQKTGLILIGLVGLALTGSSLMKLFAAPAEAVELMGDKITIIAVIELLTVIVTVIPQTRMLGIFLMGSYLGGVIATEWVNMGQAPLPGVILSTLLYAGTALYRPWLTRGAAAPASA